ncbi:MAG: hypothetical protein SFV18_01920 [Bryobacteraceae bacterium]|nr:hypothetical protein [Bryobacteraceae bacterium]
MPYVEDIRSHWIEVYSNNPVEPDYADHWFYFGLKTPRDVLVTSSISAHTVGVNYERRFVGGVSTRVHQYAFRDKLNKLQIKTLPAAADWNSEYISRCVSVAVRTTAFFANVFSLSNVYVFHRPDPLLVKIEKWATKSFSVLDGAKKVRHKTSVSGDAKAMREDADYLADTILKQAAELRGVRVKELSLRVKNGPFARLRREFPFR